MTDPQFGMFQNNEGFEKESLLYHLAITKVNEIKPDFVVITGDFVHDGQSWSQLREFRKITKKIDQNIPVYYLPGNHDIGMEPDIKSIRRFERRYGHSNFNFKYKESYFIGINSSLIKADLPKEEGVQLSWITESLKEAESANKVIMFCHYPFFNKVIDEPDAYSNISSVDRLKYLNLFNDNGVDAIFSGHYHKNSLSSFKSIELVTSGPVGKPLGGGSSGLRIIRIYTDRIEHEYLILK